MITKEQKIDYLHCDISSFGFQDLYDLVISKKSFRGFKNNFSTK